jgi:hypothetical protein
MTTKVCFKCDAEKPIEEFYRHPMMGDGYLGKCKECAKYDVRQNRRKRLDYYLQYDRERSKAPERILAIRTSREPHKRKAQVAVANALRRGNLRKLPCEICGNQKSEAHHTDYSKPLDVMWLCRKHHADWHRTNEVAA